MNEVELETNFELTLIKELNSSKLSSEEHASDMMEQIETVLIELDNNEINVDFVKMKLFKMIDDLQYQDINRQKVERVMNLLAENANITTEVLENENIAISPSAKHIDDSDGESVSEDEIAALIAANNAN